MQVQLLNFGLLRELFGFETRPVTLDQGASINDLIQSLDRTQAVSPAVWAAIAVAVNREYAVRTTILNDGDEVALLPPVSGGAS